MLFGLSPASGLDPGSLGSSLTVAAILTYRIKLLVQEGQCSWLCPESVSQKLAAEHLPCAQSWDECQLHLCRAV